MMAFSWPVVAFELQAADLFVPESVDGARVARRHPDERPLTPACRGGLAHNRVESDAASRQGGPLGECVENPGLHDYPAQRAAEDSVIRVTGFVLLKIAGPALLEGPAWEQIVRKRVA